MLGYYPSMSTIDQITEAARRLTPAEIRERLAAIERESRLLRALLRESIRAAKRAPSVDGGRP